MYKYSIEMFNQKEQAWEVHIRIYQGLKQLQDFDLCDVKGKRKNAKLI